jgi:hypothetical protein
MQTSTPHRAQPDPPARATVTAVEPADLISYVQHTLGFPPRESLTAISLNGKSLGAVLRCDWDHSAPWAASARTEQARRFASTLSRDERADGCLVLLFRDADPTAAAGPAAAEPGAEPATEEDRAMAAALARELARAGLPVVETWLVTAGRVWHLDCTQGGECPSHGSAAARAETSVLNAALVFEGSVVEDEPDGGDLPDCAPDWPADLVIALEDLLGASARECGGHAVRWLSAWEEVLSGGAVPADRAARAFLLAGLARVEWRDCLLASAGFGVGRAVSGAAWLGVVPPGVAEAFGAEAGEANGALFSSVILAATRRAPDWGRYARLRSACSVLLPEAAGPVASAVRCLAAWVEWARGRGSAAGRIVGDCRRADPDYSLGRLLEEVLDRGILSGWAGRRETAWSSTGRVQ